MDKMNKIKVKHYFLFKKFIKKVFKINKINKVMKN
jgi:hypothetical protein